MSLPVCFGPSRPRRVPCLVLLRSRRPRRPAAGFAGPLDRGCGFGRVAGVRRGCRPRCRAARRARVPLRAAVPLRCVVAGPGCRSRCVAVVATSPGTTVRILVGALSCVTDLPVRVGLPWARRCGGSRSRCAAGFRIRVALRAAGRASRAGLPRGGCAACVLRSRTPCLRSVLFSFRGCRGLRPRLFRGFPLRVPVVACARGRCPGECKVFSRGGSSCSFLWHGGPAGSCRGSGSVGWSLPDL